jgi:hypothetical protein
MFFQERQQREHVENVLRSRNIAIPNVDAQPTKPPVNEGVPKEITPDDAVAAVVAKMGA